MLTLIFVSLPLLAAEELVQEAEEKGKKWVSSVTN